MKHLMLTTAAAFAAIAMTTTSANAQGLKKIVNAPTPFAFEGEKLYFFDSGTPFFWSADGSITTATKQKDLAGLFPSGEFNGKDWNARVIFSGEQIVAANNTNGDDKTYQVLLVDGAYTLFKSNGDRISHVFAKPYVPPPLQLTPFQIKLAKKLEGGDIVAWCNDNGVDLKEMSFDLYRSDGLEVGDWVCSGELDDEGVITFSTFASLPIGWYAVVESFEKDSLAAELFEDVGPLYIYIGPNGVVTGGMGVDFDFEALYTIVNGYSQYIRNLGYPGLNNTGDIFPIGVRNTKKPDVVLPSFCAHAGSKNFAGDAGHGCAGYLCGLSGREIEAVDFDKFLSALNYIEDTIGDCNANRIITQVVTWALLGAIDVNSDEFEAANLSDDEKAFVRSVMANLGYQSAQPKIVDVAYMICELHGTEAFGLANCQPQLVPIYGSYTDVFFNNKLAGPKVAYLMATAEVTQKHSKEIHTPVYQQRGETDTIILRDGTPLVNAKKNNDHFGYQKITAAEGTFALAVGSKKTYINVDINYAIENGELKLWFDDAKYANISNGGIIAVVSDSAAKLTDATVMGPAHAKIGFGKANAATALKWYSPNGDPKHKNAVTWLAGDVKVNYFVFIHIAGLKVYDLNTIIGCTFDKVVECTKGDGPTCNVSFAFLDDDHCCGDCNGVACGEKKEFKFDDLVEVDLIINGEFVKSKDCQVCGTENDPTCCNFGAIEYDLGCIEVDCPYCNVLKGK